MEYDPPINQRTNEDLILMIYETDEDWQPEAKDVARHELVRRGVSIEEQIKWFKDYQAEWEREEKQIGERNKLEDYSFLEKIFMVLFWWREIFRGWWLRKEGYEMKARRRLQLIAIGIVIYTCYFAWVSFWNNTEKK